METTVSPRATRRGKGRRPAGRITPSRYTLRAAASSGDAFTRLSFLVLGAGNLARRQIAKGLLFLAVEIAYLAYMAVSGVPSLTTLATLGSRTQTRQKIDGYWHYDPGDNSVLLMVYGVATVFITVLFAIFWSYAVRSAYKAQLLVAETGGAPGFGDDLRDITDRNAQISFMSLPVLGILAFTVLPTLIMMCIAFTDYDSDHVLLFDWVGLRNFTQLFSDTGEINTAQFAGVLTWTLVWAFFATFLNFFLGLFLAMVINRRTTRLKGFWRAIFSLSIAVPQFVSLLVINQMLQPEGAINRLLASWGWIDAPLPFFTDTTWARVTVIVVNLWIGIPFTIMQVTGILQNIPADQYEAARLDGANWWQVFTRITMPYLVFVLTPYLITTFTGNVNNFNVIYLLSGGSPTPVGDTAGKTDLLITWLYKLTVDRGDYNLGAVIGIFTFITLAAVSLITYRSSASYKNEGGFR
ncbi:MAG: sugar ABC transporter permease [Bifidobacterium scardovii]|uniref:carbohydrate ABC transporter permease n=1 Tax=Bifidobacterium scardovii TaxID=158787 RepID=UPI0006672F5E|nr:sugar ABC transporter permease [Bifidobacterium scardovii]MBS6947944.1 sugar ABC transporter permease [Bifidobacterium scardovii]MDU3737411.1 sugar ABC transporter permease [Bifidobacterium scardovii]MDU5298103.1 sugar ABC transporter permease [Bifidobacterium scardovii]MDU5612063.1 sugar ABC transporter permease [Bifidobacterium scardovii]MDU5887651.1 sugar ABC transporter permease [Bifidobacterium scardovii]